MTDSRFYIDNIKDKMLNSQSSFALQFCRCGTYGLMLFSTVMNESGCDYIQYNTNNKHI